MPAGQPRPIRVFLDSDVLLAGSASTTGASHLILQLSELGLIDAVASEQVRREVERNLERKLPAALPAFRLLAEADGNRTRPPALAGAIVLKLRAGRDASWGFVLTHAVRAGQERLLRPGSAPSCASSCTVWSEIGQKSGPSDQGVENCRLACRPYPGRAARCSRRRPRKSPGRSMRIAPPLGL